MGGKKKSKKKVLEREIKESPSMFSNYSAPARNLRKTDLGGVIFGCKHSTINECLSNNLFGLPATHFSYIKNIKEGLVLFLFNYSDRKLHGIFEAASPGQMNINRYAWVDTDDYEYTSYPAQVRVRVRQQCNPLSENQYGPVIAYYEPQHFYFELDHDQTRKLISLFTPSHVNSSASSSQIATRCNVPLSSFPQIQANSVKNLNQVSGVSYASALGGNHTTTTSSQPTGTWSALFKPQSTSQDKAYEEVNEWQEDQNHEHKADFGQVNTWEDAECDNTWESDWNSEGNPIKDEVPEQEREDKDELLPSNTWEESALFKPQSTSQDKACEEVDEWQEDQNHEYKADFGQVNTWEDAVCDKTWESDWNSDGNPIKDEVSVLNPEMNTNTEETTGVSNPICYPSFCRSVSVSAGQLPSSSLQPLDDNSDRLMLSSSENNVQENNEKDTSLMPDTTLEISPTNLESLVVKLMKEVEVLKGSHSKQITDISLLEQELDKSKVEIQQLRNRINVLESGSQSVVVDPVEVDSDHKLKSKNHSQIPNSVFILGGFDGITWLPSVDSFLPSYDIRIPFRPMKTIKAYSSAATMNGEIYHFGGREIESFSPTTNTWVPKPPSYWNNIHVAGASVNNKLFVVGGYKGLHISSEVEYLDVNNGRWLPIHSMNSKRSAPAAAEVNNALYVTGGFDEQSYTRSVERLDPREEKWSKLPDMNKRKGCHSMVVLNEKLYTIGGFDGDQYIPTLEFFDTRMSSWIESEPMNVSRGNFGAFVLGDKLYAMGGSKENNEVLDIVECYKEGSCWEVIDVNGIGKRSHFSAIVL